MHPSGTTSPVFVTSSARGQFPETRAPFACFDRSGLPSPVSLSLWGLCPRAGVRSSTAPEVLITVTQIRRTSVAGGVLLPPHCLERRAIEGFGPVMSNARQCFDDPWRQICVCLCGSSRRCVARSGNLSFHRYTSDNYETSHSLQAFVYQFNR